MVLLVWALLVEVSLEGLSGGAPGLGLLLSRRSLAAICTSRGLTVAGISLLGWNLLSFWRGHSVTFAHLGRLSFGGVGGIWQRRSRGKSDLLSLLFIIGSRQRWEQLLGTVSSTQQKEGKPHYGARWCPCCHLGPAGLDAGWIIVGPGCRALSLLGFFLFVVVMDQLGNQVWVYRCFVYFIFSCCGRLVFAFG